MMRIENPKELSTLCVIAMRNDEANQTASLSPRITRIYCIVFYKDTSVPTGLCEAPQGRQRVSGAREAMPQNTRAETRESRKGSE